MAQPIAKQRTICARGEQCAHTAYVASHGLWRTWCPLKHLAPTLCYLTTFFLSVLRLIYPDSFFLLSPSKKATTPSFPPSLAVLWSFSLIIAPPSIRAFTQGKFPLRAAIASGVSPELSDVFGEAFCSMRYCITSE